MKHKHSSSSLILKIVAVGFIILAAYLLLFGADSLVYKTQHYASRSYFGSHVEHAGLEIELPALWSKNFGGKHYSFVRSPDDAFNKPVFVIVVPDSVDPVDLDVPREIEKEVINGMRYVGVRKLGHNYMFSMFGDCVVDDRKPCTFLGYVPSKSSTTIYANKLKKSEAWVVEELLNNIVVSDESNAEGSK